MAFFTRPNVFVPILPPIEAQNSAETNVTDGKVTNESNERYEYTVETFGVQV